jgi:LmbE family N-acetylglucosaminyl deacetylase
VTPVRQRPITPPGAWSGAIDTCRPPAFDPAAHARVVVVAAHPDDETLGAGGVLRALATAGTELTLVVATDGEAAYPGLDPAARRDLADVRRAELAAALDAQGLGGVAVTWLHLPDSGLADHASELRDALRPLLADADAYLAPWPGDPHPDHRAAGLAAAAAAPVTAHGWSYPIWMWAWMDPGEASVPWGRARLVPLDEAARAARRAGVACYRSQVGPGPDGSPAVLAAGLLDHVDRGFDLVFREPRAGSAPVERFTELYAAGDPWGAGSWYEVRKRAVVVASLPRRRYRFAFEPGCGAGELTAALAERCERIHAADPVATAVDRARARDLPGVHVERAALPDGIPAGPIDLAVFSEVLYYLDDATVAATLDRTLPALAPGADLVAVHWRGWPAEAPRDAAATHRMLRDRSELELLVDHTDEQFLLTVLSRR